MSTFGDYIHATWSGYYKHGTKRFDSNRSNFSESIFDNHKKILLERIQQDSIGLDKNSLKKMEDEYNRQQNELHSQIKSLINNKNKGNTNRSILKALIKSFNSEWSDQIADHIVDSLKWNDSKQTLVYEPKKGTFNFINTSSKKSSLPKIAKWDPNSKSHYVDRLLNSIINLQKALSLSPYKEALSDDDKKKLKNFIELLTSQKTLINKMSSKQINEEVIKGSIYSVAKIHEEANSIRFHYSGIESINQTLQAQFAEFLGNNLKKDLVKIAKKQSFETLEKMFKDSFIGRGSGENKQKASYKITQLNYSEVSAQLEKDPSLSSVLNTKESTIINPDTGEPYLTYKFSSMGDPRAQKADIVTTLTINDKETNPLAISMKNISLTNGDIKGQNSSLMLYLLGASEICDPSSNMGTQYLNTLSKHGNENNGSIKAEDKDILNNATPILNEMREQAHSTLSLHILYSAFSGYGQLRNKQQSAQILAIYDKNSYDPSNEVNRVHFFSIPFLVKTIWERNDSNKVLTPSINTILFNNPYEDKFEYFPKRITNVLIEARKQNINAIIRASLLKEITK